MMPEKKVNSDEQDTVGGGFLDEDAENKETPDNESESEGDSNSDEGGDAEEAREVEGESGQDTGEEESALTREEFLNLKKENESLKSQLNGKANSSESQNNSGVIDWGKIPEERWEKILEQTGHTDKRRFIFEYEMSQLIKNLSGQLSDLRNSKKMDEMFSSSEFKDASRYRGEIISYLSKFTPAQQSDPEIFKLAYLAAKGSRAAGAVRSAENSKERKRQVLEKGSIPKSSQSKPRTPRLSPAEISAAKKSGMSEDEYIKYKSTPNISLFG